MVNNRLRVNWEEDTSSIFDPIFSCRREVRCVGYHDRSALLPLNRASSREKKGREGRESIHDHGTEGKVIGNITRPCEGRDQHEGKRVRDREKGLSILCVVYTRSSVQNVTFLNLQFIPRVVAYFADAF